MLAYGPRAVFDAVDDLLATIAPRRFHFGEADEARYLKLLFDSLVGAMSALMAEARALGWQGGLSVETMMDVVSDNVLASPRLG